jgi:hypothetical protein
VCLVGRPGKAGCTERSTAWPITRVKT